ncbi:hypothetical protein B5V00_16355 [Geothermobacter hydrogeniphilus]|uniref:sulfate adenylyltransferase n=2 Tax=Geothermobacter hydrogeniphilus TaxID=1969733 RepID=A0A1X0XL56_9BACT|nr:hypothetical protein B5V00_16355 [Geothermobacter hydrogeniphilus]
MVTGASTAQLAVILIDARKGVLTQTRRHSYLVSLVGIRNVVLAVNKMDLVDYSEQRFRQIVDEYKSFAANLSFNQVTAIPISALEGDNILTRSTRTPWYQGPPLLEHLETVEIADSAARLPFRMRVQWVNRPDLDFRGFCGTIASGTVRPGDEIIVTSSGQSSRVARIVTMDGDLKEARAGQAVTLTLEDEIDISRGDTLAAPDSVPHHADHFEAKLVWLHEQPMETGRSYLLKAGSTTVPVQINELRFKVNVNSLDQEQGGQLQLNEVGVAGLQTSVPISFDSYRENRATGSFILIDRFTFATIGAGMIHQPLQSSGDNWRALQLDNAARARIKGQQARLLLFSGDDRENATKLPGLIDNRLYSLGRHSYLLDAEDYLQRLADRAGLADRPQALRLLAESLRLLFDSGLIVLLAAARLNDGEQQQLLEQLADLQPIRVLRAVEETAQTADDGPTRQIRITTDAPDEQLVATLLRQLEF